MNYTWHANYSSYPEIAEDCRIFVVVVVKITTVFIQGLSKCIWVTHMFQLLNIITSMWEEWGGGRDLKSWGMGNQEKRDQVVMVTEHLQTCHVSVKGLHAACSVTATSDPAKKWNRKKIMSSYALSLASSSSFQRVHRLEMVSRKHYSHRKTLTWTHWGWGAKKMVQSVKCYHASMRTSSQIPSRHVKARHSWTCL